MPATTYDTLPSPGAYPWSYSPAYGGIPQLPSPTSTAGGAITGNIQNMAGLLQQILGASGASAAGAQSQVAANLPGYAPMTQAASADILSNLQGQVPQDVRNQITQEAAERGISVGAGSPNANAALLRALGLTSLGLQNTGQQQLTAAIGRTPVGPAQNPANYLVTPAQQQDAAALQSIFNSAPVPAAAAQARMNALLAGLGRGSAGSTYSGTSDQQLNDQEMARNAAAADARIAAINAQKNVPGATGSGGPSVDPYALASDPLNQVMPDGTIVDTITGNIVGMMPSSSSYTQGGSPTSDIIDRYSPTYSGAPEDQLTQMPGDVSTPTTATDWYGSAPDVSAGSDFYSF
jgi:hypothetical protein